MQNGTFIVVDGADGSGKATQVSLLKERLISEGYDVETIDFPQYTGNLFGALLRECLDGKRGDFMSIDPRIASVLYAADRLESAPKIREWLERGAIVIADRYVSANMLHQGAKLDSEEERTAFLTWLDTMEHGVFGLPRPELIVYLDIPYAIRKHMMREDKARPTLDTAEAHEAHQIATEASAKTLISGMNNWHPVSCVEGSELRTRDAIHEDVYLAALAMVNR